MQGSVEDPLLVRWQWLRERPRAAMVRGRQSRHEEVRLVRTIITTTALALLCALPALALDHHDAGNGWTVKLPEGWVVTPQAEVNQASAEIGRRTGQPVEYCAAFHPEGQASFDYPYVLAQVHKVGGASLKDLVQVLGGPDVKQAVDRADKSLSDLTSGTNLGVPSIDERRKLVLMTMQTDVANVGPMQGLVAVFPGKDVAVQLNFYCVKADKDRDLPVCQRLFDGFAFDAGKGYSPSSGVSPGVVGGVIGGLVAAGLARAKKAAAK
jgi:hypothetical protein